MNNIWLLFAMFAVGVILVIKGGDIFVDAASWIARAFGIPSFIIGATIVSIATTLPEMIVSIMATVSGKADMAIGNAVGSVTANTGLILATAMIFMSITLKRRDYMKQCIILIATAAILWLSSYGGTLHNTGSILLIALFALFMYTNIQFAKKDMKKSEKMSIERKGILTNIVKFVLGAAAIVIGSRLLINSGSSIAEHFGVPERIIAVTMVAIGTSLPELVTTITAIIKKESGLSAGNLIGANIIDLSLILPICSVVSENGLVVSSASYTIDMPVCLGITLLAFVPLLIREKSSKLNGFILIAAYAAYLIVTI